MDIEGFVEITVGKTVKSIRVKNQPYETDPYTVIIDFDDNSSVEFLAAGYDAVIAIYNNGDAVESQKLKS